MVLGQLSAALMNLTMTFLDSFLEGDVSTKQSSFSLRPLSSARAGASYQWAECPAASAYRCRKDTGRERAISSKSGQ
jgi:hypothetical protein